MAKKRARQSVRAMGAVRPSRSPQRTWLWAGLLISVGFAVYWNSLSVPFLLDDQLSIVQNQQIRTLSPLSNALAPPRATPVAGRPLVNLSFAVNYALGGLDVRGYHYFNIAVHVLAALVLFGIIRRTLCLSSVRTDISTATTVAGAAALVWLVHPLQTETVNYLSQRTESMMGLFYLLTLYCSIRAADPRRTRRWEGAAVVACLLGMACKESMVTAPLVVALYDRIFLHDSWRESYAARWRLYSGLAATWAILAILMWPGPRSDSVGFSIGTSAWTYLLNQPLMIVRYLSLVFWPRSLVVDYGLPRSLMLGDVLLPLLIVVGLVLMTVIALIAKPQLGFLGAWFFITLAPTTSVVPIVTEVGAERRMYLPLAAIILLLIVLVRSFAIHLVATRKPLDGRILQIAGLGSLTVATALLAVGTFVRNREYASALSIAQSTVDRRPHGRAHATLGTALIAAGRRDEAVAQFRESARDYPAAAFALGTELIASGQTDEGLAQLKQFVERQPSHINVIPARELIGRTLMAEGRVEEAADQFNAILQAAPSFVDAYAYLGDLLLAQNRYAEAVDRYAEYLKTRPDSQRALDHMAMALAASGRFSEAIPFFERTIAADPKNVNARRNLVRALLELGQAGQAAVRAEEALAVMPDDPMMHDLLGLALASSGKLVEAIAHFRRSLEIDPANAETQANLKRALSVRSQS